MFRGCLWFLCLLSFQRACGTGSCSPIWCLQMKESCLRHQKDPRLQLAPCSFSLLFMLHSQVFKGFSHQKGGMNMLSLWLVHCLTLFLHGLMKVIEFKPCKTNLRESYVVDLKWTTQSFPFPFPPFFSYFLLYVHEWFVCMYVCVSHARSDTEARKGCQIPRNKVTGDCEPPFLGLGTQLKPARAAKALSWGAIFPALPFTSYCFLTVWAGWWLLEGEENWSFLSVHVGLVPGKPMCTKSANAQVSYIKQNGVCSVVMPILSDSHHLWASHSMKIWEWHICNC